MPSDEISLDDGSLEDDASGANLAFSTESLYPPPEYAEEWLANYSNWRDAAFEAVKDLKRVFGLSAHDVASQLEQLRRLVNDWTLTRKNWTESRRQIIEAMVKLNQKAGSFRTERSPLDKESERWLRLVCAADGVSPLPRIDIAEGPISQRCTLDIEGQRVQVGLAALYFLLKGRSGPVVMRKDHMDGLAKELRGLRFGLGDDLFEQGKKTKERNFVYTMKPALKRAIHVGEAINEEELVKALEKKLRLAR